MRLPPAVTLKENVMKYLAMLLLLGGFAAVNVGCEAEADVDDDGAAVKVDDKD